MSPTELHRLPVQDLQTEIPPVIHHVWIGGETPEWVAHSWHNWHSEIDARPAWTMKVWDEKAVRKNPFLRRTLDVAEFFGLAPRGISNILRVQIVGLFGGYYFDVDCLPFGQLEDLPTKPFIACRPESRDMVQMENSMFGFTAGHPFLVDVNEEANRQVQRGTKADFFLGGSRSFRTVWNRHDYDEIMDTRWDASHSRDRALREGLRDLTTVNRATLVSNFGPFPVAHVWKPRIL
jgi:hypothetical protein